MKTFTINVPIPARACVNRLHVLLMAERRKKLTMGNMIVAVVHEALAKREKKGKGK